MLQIPSISNGDFERSIRIGGVIGLGEFIQAPAFLLRKINPTLFLCRGHRNREPTCYYGGVPADNLKPESLEWALTHILKFGDTDIFPVPFEFACIKGAWSWLLPELQKIDLAEYKTRGTRRMLVPKANGGFRAQHNWIPSTRSSMPHYLMNPRL